MNTSKIEMKIGEFSFSGEGEEKWLAAQLDKILDKAEKIVNLAPPKGDGKVHPPADFTGDSAIAKQPLAKFLKEKNALTKQVAKFLATSVWLEAKGQNRLTTTDVNAAIKKASQSKLNNASDCLNQNIGKGLCEKDGNQFYVTEEGKESLGIT